MKYPIINFYRKDSLAKISIELPGLCQRPIFHMNRACDMDAQLLVDRLERDLKQHFQAMKKAAYEAGYRDGRAKSKKRTSFFGDLDHSPESM